MRESYQNATTNVYDQTQGWLEWILYFWDMFGVWYCVTNLSENWISMLWVYPQKSAGIWCHEPSWHNKCSGFRNAMCLFLANHLQVEGLQHMNFRVPGDCIWHFAKTWQIYILWNTATTSPLSPPRCISFPGQSMQVPKHRAKLLRLVISPVLQQRASKRDFKFGWDRNRNHCAKLVLYGAFPPSLGIEWLVPVVQQGCQKECGLPTKGLFKEFHVGFECQVGKR